MVNKKGLNLFIMLFVFAVLLFCWGISAFPTAVYAESTGSVKSLNVNGQIYNPEKDTGYTLTNKVSKTVFNSDAYTSLRIDVEDGNITKSTYNGFTAYGVTGTRVSLKLKINYSAGVGENINGTEYMLCDDSANGVNGIATDEIDSGALIIRTSTDGKSWSNDNKAKYTNGLYTTNYYHYHNTEETVIYRPDGGEDSDGISDGSISDGIYIQVLYAYEVYDYKPCSHKNSRFRYWLTGKKWEHDNDNVYINYVEEYLFYLCQNSAKSVTFKNLSLNGKIEEIMKEEDASFVEVAKHGETLTNGSVTVTGFLIDTSKNQAATITVKKNNQDYIIPENKKIKDNGRYDITVRTVLGEETTTTIYVFSKSKEALYSLYFKDSLLVGKRIYSKDSLPVYEGNEVSYHLQYVDNTCPRIWGTITNKTNGKVITIEQRNLHQSDVLIDAGEYEAKFNTNITYSTSSPAGDNQSFIFKFNLIAPGTAPGPQINKESLQNYSQRTNPSNLRSTYYGVTFQSAHRGNITLAFSTKKAAFDYAYNYEKGMVEVQGDGSFRYNGSLIVAQKVKYESAWDLTDAICYFAEQAVQKLRFDLRDGFTYLTLSEDVISSVENKRTLELSKSVVIFANETEKQNLLTTDNLPIINAQKYSYLTPGANGEVDSGCMNFQFVKDYNGYDSNTVDIIDSQGNRYAIEYNKDVELQLKEQGCQSGIITIEEKTVYGDTAIYNAIYIAENDNIAKIELVAYEERTKITKHIDMSNNNSSLEFNAFSIKNIVDELDAYGTIVISKDGVEDFYCYDEDFSKLYTEKGTYTITVINRLGYFYSFTIEIKDEIYSKTELSGEGIDGSQYIMYMDGDLVRLPQLTKYGYDFVGYEASDGNVYSDEVQSILLKGSSVLKTVWVAKQFKMTLKMGAEIYEETMITFGETYKLPTLAETNNQRFVGWKNASGEIISSFTVDKEGDVCLNACFETINGDVSLGQEEKMGFFAKIWDAILNFFEQIWNWIKGIFALNK